MNVLRRPEVLVLLAFVAAGLAWVWFAGKGGDGAGAGGGNAGGDGGSATLHIDRATFERDGNHRRLRIEFTADNPGAGELAMHPPVVRLIDPAGNQLPPFFRPGDFSPPLAPKSKSASWLEFWLDEGQAAGPLTLEVAGQRVAVPKMDR